MLNLIESFSVFGSSSSSLQPSLTNIQGFVWVPDLKKDITSTVGSQSSAVQFVPKVNVGFIWGEC